MRLGKKSESFWKQTKINSHNPKLMGHNKGSPERKFIAIQAYLKNIETFQTNNLTLSLLELEEQQKKTAQSKQKEGNSQDQSRTK